MQSGSRPGHRQRSRRPRQGSCAGGCEADGLAAERVFVSFHSGRKKPETSRKKKKKKDGDGGWASAPSGLHVVAWGWGWGWETGVGGWGGVCCHPALRGVASAPRRPASLGGSGEPGRSGPPLFPGEGSAHRPTPTGGRAGWLERSSPGPPEP